MQQHSREEEKRRSKQAENYKSREAGKNRKAEKQRNRETKQIALRIELYGDPKVPDARTHRQEHSYYWMALFESLTTSD